MKPSYDLHVLRPELPQPLRPYVHECYETGIDVPAGEVERIPISATTDPVLNVMLSGSLHVRIGRGFRIPPVTLAGPQPAAYEIEARGRWRGFYIRFATVGPLVLLGIESYSLKGGARPLHEMVRPGLADAARVWERELLDAPDFVDRMALTERFLLDSLEPPDHRAQLLESAIREMERMNGDVRIGDVARRLGVTPGTLRRHFAALGTSPKRFASVLRFRRAHALLQNTPDASWASVAIRMGYADQAHLVRDYGRFSGTPPSGWRADVRFVDRRMGIERPPEGE